MADRQSSFPLAVALQVANSGGVFICWAVDGGPHGLALEQTHGLDIVLRGGR